ncbi:MAG TPA: hypothetical protein VN757_00300 [Steroidobacteraceae bacterium]|nr:hypothetical protein [Steroidobacteraceae bacterium]
MSSARGAAAINRVARMLGGVIGFEVAALGAALLVEFEAPAQ